LYPLVEDLCRANESFFDAAKCLVRTKTVGAVDDKLSGHMASIEKSRCCEITDESIAILFDDVTTNGASLKAGHDILKAAGYKTIICIAIAKNYMPEEESEEIIVPVLKKEN
ncbi:MAG: phosphoribosyltransferase, partial [Peptococcaceae bacterium]|nr:phosphoribosyltransferase [Peptococcaceae bacterium]